MAKASKTAISVKGLVKRFGDLSAVKGITFSVKEGEIFGFLGPNGAGKSMTINMLTTLLVPTGGDATVAGVSVVGSPETVRERICLISQEGSVDGDLTAEENLVFYGRLYHVPEKELSRRVDRALEFVNLSDRRATRVKFYSGGMRRRLEMAKVFISDPKVIFLDEPTIGLDPQSRDMVWKKIFEINRSKGITIFVTTHYMQEAEGLCNRIAIMDHGKIIAMDTPAALREGIGIGEIVEVEVRHDGAFHRALAKAGFEVEPLSRNKYRITAKGSGGVERVVGIARKSGTKIINMLARRPTMEDVFMHYTGREVRDGTEAGNLLTKVLARNARGGG